MLTDTTAMMTVMLGAVAVMLAVVTVYLLTVMTVVQTLNEWDSRVSGGVEWRQKLDSQRGAVLANELKCNASKLAKWTCQALLAGSDQIKFG